MPGIIHAQCETCGKGPETSASLAGWDAKEMPEGGKRFGDPYLAFRLEDGKLLGLPHPGEQRHLEALGYKWSEASRQGRLHGVSHKVCTQCGMVHEEAQVGGGLAMWGCFAFPASGVVGFVLLKTGFRLPWQLCGIIALLVMLGLAKLVDYRDRARWREVNEELKLTRCSGCGGGRFVTFNEATKERLPCPVCKTKTMRYSIVGKS